MDIKQTRHLVNSRMDSSIEFEPSSYETHYSMHAPSFVSRKCVLGVCCMDEKCFGKPMQALISRLRAVGDFDIIVFGEKLILNEPPEHWPQCDCLIAFFSKGFPLKKAMKYCELHPTTYCVNEFSTQEILLDRRAIFALLQKNGIPGAKRLQISRDGYEPQQTFVEGLNWIEIDGVRLDKPFVEKPADGEDHNVYIYYHEQQGGGSVRLFRKVDNKSSERFPDINTVRRNGSYVYEEYIATENAYDIKVYTVGPDYAHAEARKSPVVDGMVIRDKEGKEVRHKVELSEDEKKMSQKIVKVLGQRVCGFDLLRDLRSGLSYVCDVNGWSFVKGNMQFYDDCARVLREIFLHAMVSKGLPIMQPTANREFRGLISVFRHADRTPKQKLKIKVSNKQLLSFFEDDSTDEVKLKSDTNRAQLDQLLEMFVDIINDPKKFEGIEEKDRDKLYLIITVLRGRFGGTKVQIKAFKHIHVGPENKHVITQALFVIKWGGILTHSGIEQARILGKTFYDRVLPPTEKETWTKGVKIFSNNERRVKRTAEEFAMGFLGVDELDPHLINDDKATAKMLGNIAAGKKLQEKMKSELQSIMHMEDVSSLDLMGCDQLGNPLETMKQILSLMKEFQDEQEITGELCENETVRMMEQRWERLSKNFYNAETGKFDVTKIPDIFDYITYEVIHNQRTIGHDLYELFQKALNLARFVVVEEYGLRPEDKFAIGSLISKPLIKSIHEHLVEIAKGNKGTKSVFYFSSESHLQSLRNILLHSGAAKFYEIQEPIMLNYLTHIVFKIYENLDIPVDQPHRFQIEVLFSSGTSDNPFGINDQHLQHVAPMISIHDRLSFRRVEDLVKRVNETYDSLKHHKQSSEHE